MDWLDGLAIDGKIIRNSAAPGGGTDVRLFSALLHQEQVVIAQIEVPEDTTEVTCVAELLDAVNLEGKVVTADAAHGATAAEYVTGTRDADYVLTAKGVRLCNVALHVGVRLAGAAAGQVPAAPRAHRATTASGGGPRPAHGRVDEPLVAQRAGMTTLTVRSGRHPSRSGAATGFGSLAAPPIGGGSRGLTMVGPVTLDG